MALRFIIFICFLSVFIGCSNNEKTTNLILKKDCINENNNIYLINGYDIDQNGNFYIGDGIDYSIKKFNPYGQFLIKVGKRGKGPGEFSSIRTITVNKNFVFVIDYKDHSVIVFDTSLVFIKKIQIKNGDPYNLLVTKNGNLIVVKTTGYSSIIEKHKDPLGLDSVLILKEFGIKDKNPLFNFLKLNTDNDNNYLISFYFENTLNIYDHNFNLIKNIKLNFLLDAKTSKEGIPYGSVIENLCFSSSNIFILEGTASKKQKIFQLDSTYKLMQIINLPEQSSFLKIRRGMFFLTNRLKTNLKEYYLQSKI